MHFTHSLLLHPSFLNSIANIIPIIYICMLLLKLYSLWLLSHFVLIKKKKKFKKYATRKRRTGWLRFKGQYDRLENSYFSSTL